MHYATKEEFLKDIRQHCPILFDMRALDPQMTETHETKLWFMYAQYIDANEKRLEAEKKLLTMRQDRNQLWQQVIDLQNEARNFSSGVFFGAVTAGIVLFGLWAAFAA